VVPGIENDNNVLPTTGPSTKWQRPEVCTPQNTGTVWSDVRDGYQPRLPLANDPNLKILAEALDDLKKKEPLLNSENTEELRKAALQLCQLKEDVNEDTKTKIQAKIDANRGELETAQDDLKTAKENDPLSVETIECKATVKRKKKTKQKLERQLKKISGVNLGAGICKLAELITNGAEATPSCTYEDDDNLIYNLLVDANAVCAENVEMLRTEWKEYWDLIGQSTFTAWNDMLKTDEKAEAGCMKDQSFFANMNFYEPGEGALRDPMHAFFRFVQSITSTILAHLRARGYFCTLSGTSTRLSIFTKMVDQTCDADVGPGVFSKVG